MEIMAKTLFIFSVFFTALLFMVPEAPGMAGTKEVQLPAPVTRGTVSLEEAIAKRRSQRIFKDRALTLEQISQLLWAGQGITGEAFGQKLRAAPSAGALYPLELYAVSKDGVFHYLPERHVLEVQGDKDVRSELAQAAQDQVWIGKAPFIIVVCAVYARVRAKYVEHGIRYVDMEAGHAAQNIQLQAVTLGLGLSPVGSFLEKDVRKVLGLPADRVPLYVIPVGYTE
jgi:SagB-type dehydrogenase family enzyme